jgi:hypothetical protein
MVDDVVVGAAEGGGSEAMAQGVPDAAQQPTAWLEKLAQE